MEFIKAVKIDELGRILLPRPIRDTNSWPVGTKLDVYVMDGNTVVIKLHEPAQED